MDQWARRQEEEFGEYLFVQLKVTTGDFTTFSSQKSVVA